MKCPCGAIHPKGICYYNKDPLVRQEKLFYKANYRSSRREELTNKEKERMKDPIKHQQKLEWDRAYKKRDGYREKYNDYQRLWHRLHPNAKKNEYKRNHETYRIRAKKHYAENSEAIKAQVNDYYWNRGGREKVMAYYEQNPRPKWRSEYPELLESMENVRRRDNNTCQWYGCGRKYKRGETGIEVHHIFPRAEYPEFELVEQYMICYCVEHHFYWHFIRGDEWAARFIGFKLK